MTESIDRRSFLKGGLLAGAGAMAAGMIGCSPSNGTKAEEPSFSGDQPLEKPRWSWDTVPEPIPDDEIIETIDAEIVVVGAGISGLPAAMYAAEHGTNVHVIEKQLTYGTHRSGFAAVNARVQKEVGIELDRNDRTEALNSIYQISGRYQVNQELWARYFDESGEMADWLTDIAESKGAHIRPGLFGIPTTGENFKTPPAPQSVSGFWGGWDMQLSFYQDNPAPFAEDYDWTGMEAGYAEEQGAVFHYGEAGIRLIREDDNKGRVSAVITEDRDGKFRRYNASKGIILTSGDFIHDDEMLECYAPQALMTFYNYGEPTNTGQMHRAGMWIGAMMEDMAVLDHWPGQTTTGKSLRPQDDPSLAAFSNWCWQPALAASATLWVDQNGRRFTCEETAPGAGSTSTANCLTSVPAGGWCWSIWDGAWEEKYASVVGSFSPMTFNTPEQMEADIKEGLTIKADTLDELIEKMGVDPAVFKATLERYNQLCAEGYDSDCLKSAQWLQTIDTPPYYAASIGTAIDCVRCGLVVDRNMQCIDADAKPIEGLYASGNVAGGWYGDVYTPMFGASGTGHGMFGGWLAAKILCGNA